MKKHLVSSYDEIFNKYYNFNILKKGTKYEMLTAIVYKNLYDKSQVIHDIKLIGESRVKHQIDVFIEDSGKKKRILIECKDFNISKNKVGVGIIRDFSSVVDDIKPSEAFVITCNGFTRNAKKFAKYKNIKLLVLKNFTDEDNNGRINKFILRINLHSLTNPIVNTIFENEKFAIEFKMNCEKEKINPSVVSKDNPLYLKIKDKLVQFNEYVERIWSAHSRNVEGHVKINHLLNNSTIVVGNRTPIPISSLDIEFDVIHSLEIHDFVSDKVAELILKGFNNDDFIIFDQDIKRYKINKNSGDITKI